MNLVSFLDANYKSFRHPFLKFFSTPRTFLVFIILLTLTFGVGRIENLISSVQESQESVAGESETNKEEKFVKGQIIVKFRDNVTECVECVIEGKKSFKDKTSDNSSSLDVLNTKYQVKSAQPLFRTKSDKTLNISDLKKNEEEDIEKVKQKFSQRTKRGNPQVTLPSLYHTYLLTIPENQDVREVVADFRRDPHVEYAHPDYIGEFLAAPNDPYYSSVGSWGQPYDDLWALKRVQPDSNWWSDNTTNGNGVVVAVIDGGVDYNHEDLANNIWINTGEIPNNGQDDDNNDYPDDIRGWNFIGINNNPMDENGHGTGVAGIIAAVGNNSKGIIGIAPKAKIMPIKIGGVFSHATKSIYYAARNGADVINASWTFSGLPRGATNIMTDAVKIAHHGYNVVVVTPAGNTGVNVNSLNPQWMDETIKVAGTLYGDQRYIMSGYGITLDVAAPGVGTELSPPSYHPLLGLLTLKSDKCVIPSGILTICDPGLLVANNYARTSGTSFANAYVSGAAAAILSKYPTQFSNRDIRQVLRISADDIESPGFDDKSGAGRINLQRALSTDSIIRLEITFPYSSWSFRLGQSPAEIYGTVLGIGPNHHFSSWQLYYAEQVTALGSTPNWQPIGTPSTNQVGSGLLSNWDISNLNGLNYMLKLEARSSDNPVKIYQYIIGDIHITPHPTYENRPLPINPNYQTAPQDNPKASGNRVIYRDIRDGARQLRVYDFTYNSEQLIANQYPGDAYFLALDISGDKIIWEEYNPANSQNTVLYLHDLAVNQRYTITNASRPLDGAESFTLEPAIWGNNIVWRDRALNNREYLYICTYDPVTHTCPPRQIEETEVITNPVWDHQIRQIDIHQNLVVWKDKSSHTSPLDILKKGINVYDHKADKYYVGINDPNNYFHGPKVSGQTLVWYDKYFTTAWYLNWCRYATYLSCDVSKIVSGANSDTYKYNPDISGDRVVWEDITYPPGTYEIYLTQLQYTTGTEILITDSAAEVYSPSISAGRVFWTDYRNGGYLWYPDIYYADIGNRVPEILTGNQNAFVGQNLLFTLSVDDKDGDFQTLSASQLPPGATFDPATGIFSFTPQPNQLNDIYNVIFTASDGRDSTTKQISISVLSGTPTPTPTPTPRPSGDANADGYVDVSDLSILLPNYNTLTSNGPSAGDFNLDSSVSLIDYAIWATTYSPPPPPLAGPVTLYPTEDAHVTSSSPTTNYGNNTVLEVDGYPLKYTFMKFDLTPYANNTITSAKLRLKITNSSTNTHNIRSTASSWNENTIAFFNFPALGSIINSFPGGNQGTWREIDITSYIQTKLGTITSLGIDSTGTDDLYFYSSENSGDKPQLVLN